MRKTAILSILALLLFLPFFASVSVYADAQDVVYNFDSTTYDGVVCKNNDSTLPACTDYKYLKIETDFVVSNLYNQHLVLSPNGFSKNVIPVNQTWDLSQMTNLTQFYVAFNLLSGTNYTATITLTNDSGCPEPEPCPSCPDCSDASQFISVVIDAFWKFVIAFAGAGASLIAILLVFRYMRKVF